MIRNRSDPQGQRGYENFDYNHIMHTKRMAILCWCLLHCPMSCFLHLAFPRVIVSVVCVLHVCGIFKLFYSKQSLLTHSRFLRDLMTSFLFLLSCPPAPSKFGPSFLLPSQAGMSKQLFCRRRRFQQLAECCPVDSSVDDSCVLRGRWRPESPRCCMRSDWARGCCYKGTAAHGRPADANRQLL